MIDFAVLKKMFRTVTEGKQQIAARRDAARRQREDVFAKPKSDEQLLQDYFSMIDRRASEFIPTLLQASAGLRAEWDVRSDQLHSFLWGGGIFQASGFNGSGKDPQAIERALCFVCGDQMKEELKNAHAKGLLGRVDGLTKESRETQLTKIDSEIAEYDEQIKAIDNELRGIAD